MKKPDWFEITEGEESNFAPTNKIPLVILALGIVTALITFYFTRPESSIPSPEIPTIQNPAIPEVIQMPKGDIEEDDDDDESEVE